MRELIPVFVSAMEQLEENGLTPAKVIRMAHTLGYEIVPFNGWDDHDFAGQWKALAKINRKRLNEITVALETKHDDGSDWPLLRQDRT